MIVRDWILYEESSGATHWLPGRGPIIWYEKRYTMPYTQVRLIITIYTHIAKFTRKRGTAPN